MKISKAKRNKHFREYWQKNRERLNLEHLKRQPRTVAVTCVDCGRIVLTGFQNTKYCEPCKKKVLYKKQTEYQHRNRVKINFRLRQSFDRTVAVTCIVCGKLVLCSSRSTHFCSKECRYKLTDELHRYRYCEYRGRTVAVECIECGKLVVTSRQQTKYCKRCHKKVTRNLQHKYQKDLTIRNNENKEVYVAVTCVICGKVVPLKKYKPLSGGLKMYCDVCRIQVYRTIPKLIMQQILHWNRSVQMPRDLEIWDKIWSIRKDWRDSRGY